MKCTSVEKVINMLRMARLSKSFYGETVRTMCINRSPSILSDFEVPEKVWTGKRCFLFSLDGFGYKAFADIPKE